MATLQELSDALIKADAAGNVEDARALANAIRQAQSAPAPSADAIPGARSGVPQWGQEYPTAYKVASGARDVLGDTVEALTTIGGGAAGSFLGPAGTVAGAGLGYGIGKEITTAADVALGRRPARTPFQTVKEPVENVLSGATFEAAAGPVVRGAASVLDFGKRNMLKAKKIAEESLGNLDTNAVRNFLAQSQPNITAAQATAGFDRTAWQALNERVAGRTVAASDYKYATQEAQEAARQAGIKAVTPDLKASIAARDLIAQPYYQAADSAIVPLDPPMMTLFERMPAGTLEAAAQIAKMDGRPFILNAQPGQALPEVTGETLHYIKRALSDMANAAPSVKGVGRDTQTAARGVLNDFVKEFETRVPDYAMARAVYADLSKPVNQAEVLESMMKVLEQGGGGERVLPFLNVLGRGEQALLKKSTGFARYEAGDLRKVLTPEQMAAVDDVVSQLTRDIKISEQAKTGREALRDVLVNNLSLFRLPTTLNLKGTVTNEILNKVEQKVGRKVMDTLTESLKTAKTAEELFSVLPAHERIKVINVMHDIATNPNIAQRAARTGFKEAATKEKEGNVFLYAKDKLSDAYGAARNMLAPETQNQNALAR